MQNVLYLEVTVNTFIHTIQDSGLYMSKEPLPLYRLQMPVQY